MLLEVTFGKLYAWAIQNVRNILLDANAKFKELGEPHFVAVGSGQNCFKLILFHFLKFPIIGILKLVPLVCAEKYFDFLSILVSFYPIIAILPNFTFQCLRECC